MAISKIQFKASAQATPVVWMDVTQDTVAAAHLETAYTAHDASGTQITGTLVPGGGPSYTWETVINQNITIYSDITNYAVIYDYLTPIGANETYRVTFGSSGTYVCDTWASFGPTEDGYSFGNTKFDDGDRPDTGEPFVFYRDFGTALVCLTDQTPGSVHVLIEKKVESSGGGLEYETGTYTPSEDIVRPTINFAKTHSDMPVIIIMSDATGTFSNQTNTTHVFMLADYLGLTGQTIYTSSTAIRNAAFMAQYRSTDANALASTTVGITEPRDSTTESSNYYYRYSVSESWFKPYSNSTQRYWRVGRTYKWIAIWAPTT